MDEKCRRGLVDVSVKVVVDVTGELGEDPASQRPLTGFYTTDAQIHRAILNANQILTRNGAEWNLYVSEILEVPGIFDDGDGLENYSDIESRNEAQRFEATARARPDLFQWRSDAINVYIADTMPWNGTSAYPGEDREAIFINNSSGIPNGGGGWMHEIGHYLGLTHTSDPVTMECDPTLGASHGCFRGDVTCDDMCPDETNVMSLHEYSLEDARLSECQLLGMAYRLDAINYEGDVDYGVRNHVVYEALTPPDMDEPPPPEALEPFYRGDSNSDGEVDIADPIHILLYLFVGSQLMVCPSAADVNTDAEVNVVDAVAILDVLFRSVGSIAAPGSAHCSGYGEYGVGLGTCRHCLVGCALRFAMASSAITNRCPGREVDSSCGPNPNVSLPELRWASEASTSGRTSTCDCRHRPGKPD